MEVFPPAARESPELACFLHVRGGVSSIIFIAIVVVVFSPRAWRCFPRPQSSGQGKEVFSTCVEVFLILTGTVLRTGRFLHVRGGVSFIISSHCCRNAFSPRAWRCFLVHPPRRARQKVFSTCVEVFLKILLLGFARTSFLHVRGGVS